MMGVFPIWGVAIGGVVIGGIVVGLLARKTDGTSTASPRYVFNLGTLTSDEGEERHDSILHEISPLTFYDYSIRV